MLHRCFGCCEKNTIFCTASNDIKGTFSLLVSGMFGFYYVVPVHKAGMLQCFIATDKM